MLCLGIETSCDETAMALVRDGRLVAERVSTQIAMHSVFGGVVPELASREHLRLLEPLLAEVLAEAGATRGEIDLIAVARGPGLLGSLLVGLGFAKGLALALDRPLIGVNHLHAHLLVAGLEETLSFPALGLLVSGGHTHIYRMDAPDALQLLGRTLDDAAGEAFDKVAKFLNFPYPGGRFLDELSQGGTVDTSLFPRPYLENDNLDFSFSGLKTAVANHVGKHPELVLPSMDAFRDPGFVPSAAMKNVCASFNWAVASTLQVKVERGLDASPGVEALYVAGGVAANSMIRKVMTETADRRKIRLILPRPGLCTDNGAMVAYLGYLLGCRGKRHGLDLEAVPRGRPIPDDFVSIS
jgi:N6-L-threonylcarbamoyladenine synthase